MASAPHQYPGVNLPLRYVKQKGRAGVDFYRCGSFNGAAASLSELIQVREVMMMMLMDALTDKPNWHEKVFDETIVAKWRHEAVTLPEEDMYQEIVAGKQYGTVPMPTRTRFMTEATFDYVSWPKTKFHLIISPPKLQLTLDLTVHCRAAVQGCPLQGNWPSLHS